MTPTPDSTIRQRLKALDVISGAMLAALMVYVVVGWALVHHRSPVLEDEPSGLLVGVLCGLAVLLLLGAHLLVRGRVRGLTAAPPAAAAVVDAYIQANIFAFALREAVGLFGLVLTILSGRELWVVLFATLAAADMLIAWPRRGAIAAALGEDTPVEPE